MNKVEVLSKFQEFKKPFYTFADLQLILGLEKLSANKRIIDLVKQGFLLKLARNVFVPSFWPYDLLRIANYMNQPAYLSFEAALKFHDVLLETNEVLTFASPIISNKREVAGKLVVWSKINEKLFFGFELINDVMVASKEKALADLVYLSSFGKASFYKGSIDWSKIDLSKLEEIINKYPKQTQELLVNSLK